MDAIRKKMKNKNKNENKVDELTRKLGVQEDELLLATDRAELADKKLSTIEEELQTVGENMKHLEKSASDALEREDERRGSLTESSSSNKNTKLPRLDSSMER